MIAFGTDPNPILPQGLRKIMLGILLRITADQPHHAIRTVEQVLGLADPHAFHGRHPIIQHAQARRIAKHHRQTIHIDGHIDNITRRPGLRRHQGRIALHKRIQQGRLPAVGRTGQNHAKPVAQSFRPTILNVPLKLGDKTIKPFRERIDHGAGHIVLVGEIKIRLHQGPHIRDRITPGQNPVTRPPGKLAHGLLTLGIGGGMNQIANSLHLGKVHLAVQKSLAGKGARLGRRNAGQGVKRGQQTLHHRTTAMAMELGHIVTGETVRLGKEKDQRIVQRPPRCRIAQGGTFRMACLRHTAGNPFEGESNLRTRHANDRNAGRNKAGGKRRNRSIIGHRCSSESITRTGFARPLMCSSCRRTRHWSW